MLSTVFTYFSKIKQVIQIIWDKFTNLDEKPKNEDEKSLPANSNKSIKGSNNQFGNLSKGSGYIGGGINLFPQIKVIQRIDASATEQKTEKVIQKVSKVIEKGGNIALNDILESKQNLTINVEDKKIIKQIAQNVSESKGKDEDYIKEIKTKNSNELEEYLLKINAAKLNFNYPEIENLKKESIAWVETQKAEIYFQTGKAYADLLLFQKAKEDLTLALNTNPNNFEASNKLVEVLINLDELENAKNICTNIISKLAVTNQIENLSIAYENLGQIYRHIGDYQKSLETYEEIIRILNFAKNTDLKYIAANYSNVAIINLIMGENEKAKQNFVKAINYLVPNFDYNNPVEIIDKSVAKIYNCIGISLAIYGNYNASLKFIKLFLKILDELENRKSINPYLKAIGYVNTSVISFYAGQYKQASIYATLAKEYIQDNFGANYSLLAHAYASFGNLHLWNNEFGKAERDYNRAYKILTNSPSRSNQLKAATILCHQANVYRNKRMQEESDHFYLQALQILETVFDDSNPNIRRIQNNLQNIAIENNIILAF